MKSKITKKTFQRKIAAFPRPLKMDLPKQPRTMRCDFKPIIAVDTRSDSFGIAFITATIKYARHYEDKQATSIENKFDGVYGKRMERNEEET